LKDFLRLLSEREQLVKVKERLSVNLEISSVIQGCQKRALLFDNVAESPLKIAANLYGDRSRLALGVGINPSKSLLEFVADSAAHPSGERGNLSSFERTLWEHNVEADLIRIPILTHFQMEAGPYITAGIVAAKLPGTKGENLSFHRMLVLSKNKVAVRIVPRHLEQIGAIEAGKKIPVSVIIGPPPAVFLSASLQTEFGLSEYKIANRMLGSKLELVESENSDIAVPKDSEIILEGFLDYSERVKEGPFVDLTNTYDQIREQPVITFERMHYSDHSVYQAVLAGSSEHALFMGLPQELKIREALSKAIPSVRGINLTSSSSGYFHCIVSLRKANDGDGKTAIMNCFAASHPLKLVVAVDEDIDPFSLDEVEWALATRFQASDGIVLINGARGSSLDPSSEKSAVTSKLGLDATLPVKAEKSKFSRAKIDASDKAKSIVAEINSR
jgi:2,5-furandicarboxylate decarboxylase 1